MKPPRDLLPFLVTLAAVGLLSLMDAVMKLAALAAGTYATLVVRNGFSLAIVGPVYLATRKGRPTRQVLRLHALRGVVIAGMSFTFFWGLTRLPLAEAIALSFTAPLVALYLAAVLLGEKIARGAIAASLLGLAGVLIIAWGRMDGPAADEGTALGIAAVLVSSLLYAWNLVLQRQQALVAKPVEVATFQTIVSGFVFLLFAPWFFTWPDTASLPWIAAAAAMSVGGAMLLVWAYARAEAQALIPLEYSGFLWAMLFGWLFFREPVSAPTLVGAVLIVAGCWIAAPRKPPELTAA
ncbi:EamA family transporter [Altererythrobacter salegens]|uniref:EamA family transporter n=1 Tax=Croceibacterium salegens TaxID=1737568 RepID=A0A6I4SVF5_9SPHN|nr:DMT family transporter [Croceibacterium salegens]MXO59040.1 EamA family transporter [Croceibacterium salegens]